LGLKRGENEKDGKRVRNFRGAERQAWKGRLDGIKMQGEGTDNKKTGLFSLSSRKVRGQGALSQEGLGKERVNENTSQRLMYQQNGGLYCACQVTHQDQEKGRKPTCCRRMR